MISEEIRHEREKYAATRAMPAWPMTEDEPLDPSERARKAHEEALDRMFPKQHVPYTGKRYVPDYYKPQRKNPRISEDADASDVSHAFKVKDPRVANVIERLLRAGKKPGESYLKDLNKAAEDLHRAIEYAEMEGSQ